MQSNSSSKLLPSAMILVCKPSRISLFAISTCPFDCKWVTEVKQHLKKRVEHRSWKAFLVNSVPLPKITTRGIPKRKMTCIYAQVSPHHHDKGLSMLGELPMIVPLVIIYCKQLPKWWKLVQTLKKGCCPTILSQIALESL